MLRENWRSLEAAPGTEVFTEATRKFLMYTTLRKSQIRDDFLKLIELTMIILGNPPTKIQWRARGRSTVLDGWQSCCTPRIYIYLFRDQRDAFKLTVTEETQLHRFVQFSALLYTKAWIEALLATEAPGQDLKLWTNLTQYEAIDPKISTAARYVLEHHLWYLSDEAVGLALFSDRILAVEKVKIVEGMIPSEPDDRNVGGDSTVLREKVSLVDFVTKR